MDDKLLAGAMAPAKKERPCDPGRTIDPSGECRRGGGSLDSSIPHHLPAQARAPLSGQHRWLMRNALATTIENPIGKVSCHGCVKSNRYHPGRRDKGLLAKLFEGSLNGEVYHDGSKSYNQKWLPKGSVQ